MSASLCQPLSVGFEGKSIIKEIGIKTKFIKIRSD